MKYSCASLQRKAGIKNLISLIVYLVFIQALPINVYNCLNILENFIPPKISWDSSTSTSTMLGVVVPESAINFTVKIFFLISVTNFNNLITIYGKGKCCKLTKINYICKLNANKSNLTIALDY